MRHICIILAIFAKIQDIAKLHEFVTTVWAIQGFVIMDAQPTMCPAKNNKTSYFCFIKNLTA
jgi:hypothetical protein